MRNVRRKSDGMCGREKNVFAKVTIRTRPLILTSTPPPPPPPPPPPHPTSPRPRPLRLATPCWLKVLKISPEAFLYASGRFGIASRNALLTFFTLTSQCGEFKALRCFVFFFFIYLLFCLLFFFFFWQWILFTHILMRLFTINYCL
jgi:hypothetical protein